ncbi:MAG: WhiB family transcriptional regulator [Pseudonocardia sp.]
MAETWNWRTAARCRVADADGLFARGRHQREARRFCDACPVRTECLAHALDQRVEIGVWGGMTERERRALLKDRPQVQSWAQLLESARRAHYIAQVDAAQTDGPGGGAVGRGGEVGGGAVRGAAGVREVRGGEVRGAAGVGEVRGGEVRGAAGVGEVRGGTAGGGEVRGAAGVGEVRGGTVRGPAGGTAGGTASGRTVGGAACGGTVGGAAGGEQAAA